MLKPTTEVYTELQEMFDFFNQELFEGQLPQCLIVLQRSRGVRGYFAYSHWKNEKEKEIDEIALNPSCFLGSDLKTILSTFIHEMCHLWQSHFGTPAKNGYHNQEWGDKTEEVGLVASHTGMVGGNKTGYKMTHYILPEGIYEEVFGKLQKLGGKMTWIESIGQGGKKITPRKTKYVFRKCNVKVWGKSELNILCKDCNEILEEEF